MVNFAVVWILFWGFSAIPFTYYLCFTQAGRDLMWSLLRFNPMQRNLFADQKAHDATLKIFGSVFMVLLLLALLAVVYRLFVPLE